MRKPFTPPFPNYREANTVCQDVQNVNAETQCSDVSTDEVGSARAKPRYQSAVKAGAPRHAQQCRHIANVLLNKGRATGSVYIRQNRMHSLNAQRW